MERTLDADRVSLAAEFAASEAAARVMDGEHSAFSGSGTQLIAAEELGRRCFAMELSPAFVDAAILRWQRATGHEAVLEETGETFAITADRRLT